MREFTWLNCNDLDSTLSCRISGIDSARIYLQTTIIQDLKGGVAVCVPLPLILRFQHLRNCPGAVSKRGVAHAVRLHERQKDVSGRRLFAEARWVIDDLTGL